MTLEQEMRHEIYRLEQEIMQLDKELKMLAEKLEMLGKARKKKEHDVRILKSSFGEAEKRELQTTLVGVL